MSFSRRAIIVAAFAVVSLPARSAVDQAPAERATDPVYYTGDAAAFCTHPLFVNRKYHIGDGVGSVTVGDFDGVNGPDRVVRNRDSGNVSVLLNQGDGTFSAAVAYDAGTWPRSVAIGDLDGVNGPDLAVTNRSDDDVSVLLNLGTAQVCPWDIADPSGGPPDGTSASTTFSSCWRLGLAPAAQATSWIRRGSVRRTCNTCWTTGARARDCNAVQLGHNSLRHTRLRFHDACASGCFT